MINETGRDDGAIYLALRANPRSEESMSLQGDIINSVRAKSKAAVTKKVVNVIGNITADLLTVASKDVRGWSYRPMASGSFTGERVGYHVFSKAVRLMETCGWISIVSGYGGGMDPAVATRFRATGKLLRHAKDAGICLSRLKDHFEVLPRPKEISQPIAIRTSAIAKRGKKVPGRGLRVDLCRSPARELAKQVNDLNAFFADTSLEPAEAHYAFQRIFNLADDPGFAWNKGARLYSLGDSYQQMPRTERAKLKLNGEAVVELDLRASHLTILHALLKLAFDPTKDPYAVPGLPRQIVKAWVTMTLGHDRFQRCWSKENKRKYREQTGGDLQKDYPLKTVRETILRHLPVLTDWPTSKVRWGDLQFIESEVIIGTIETLAFKHRVPALPVHDSIIVPKSDEELATGVLKAQFAKIVGLTPAVSSS